MNHNKIFSLHTHCLLILCLNTYNIMGQSNEIGLFFGRTLFHGDVGYINAEKSMMLGTAGFTAILCAFAVKAREELLLGEKVNEVLVTGATGGVGIVAVMALSKLGCNVTAVTGKIEKTKGKAVRSY